MIAAPISIPSPSPDWKQIHLPFGEWLHGILPFIPEDWALRITSYALVIIVGIFAAVLIANRRLTRRGAEPWIIVDVGIWAVVLGIVFARAYHVLTHLGDYVDNPRWWDITADGNVWAIWQGGGAIFGALIGGALGVWIGCRITGLRFWSVADAIAPGLLVAQAFGRLGNWFNQELFGLPTDLPWGLEIDRPNAAIPEGIPDDVLFHPTFLYEIIWNLVGFALIIWMTEKVVRVAGKRVTVRRDFWQWGKVLGAYLVWYGVGRSWFESIRLDPSDTFLGIRSNVWTALAAIALGLIIIAVQTRRHPGVEPDVYHVGRRPEPPAAVHSEDTYSESDSDDADDDAAEVAETAATSGSSR